MTRRSKAGVALFLLIVTWSLAIGGTPVVFSAPPSPTPTTAVPSVSGDTSYTVQPGDSVWSIAVKFYGSGIKYTQIIAANNLPESVRLRVGQVIIIPGVPSVDPTLASTGPTAVAPLAQVTPTLTLRPLTSPTPLPSLVAVVTAPTTAPPPAEKASTTTRPSSGLLSLFATPEFMRLLDILSGILAGSSVVCAAFAYQAYSRAQRLQRMTRVRRRSRVHIDHLS